MVVVVVIVAVVAVLVAVVVVVVLSESFIDESVQLYWNAAFLSAEVCNDWDQHKQTWLGVSMVCCPRCQYLHLHGRKELQWRYLPAVVG